MRRGIEEREVLRSCKSKLNLNPLHFTKKKNGIDL